MSSHLDFTNSSQAISCLGASNVSNNQARTENDLRQYISYIETTMAKNA